MRSLVRSLATLCLTSSFLAASSLLATPALAAAPLRLGIIGTDSSHSVEFTRLLNDATAKDHVEGAVVVAAYRGGNPALPLSRDRIEGFTNSLRTRWQIPFVDHINDLCPRVDGLLLLSVDAAARMNELKQAAACHKPVFIDKPLANSLPEAKAIMAFADSQHLPWFSASALRFRHTTTTRADAAEVWGPGALGVDAPLDLAWYGIHSIEALYSLMGPGVDSVARIHSENTDLLTATWKDGRIGTVRMVRPEIPFGALAFYREGAGDKAGDKAPESIDLGNGYVPLMVEIVRFMQTGKPPLSPADTFEVFEFMQAAQESQRLGGKAVRLP